MQKLLREYLDELNRRQKKSRKAAIAALLLVVMVVGSVAGILAQYGIAMTGVAKCGLEEHQHSEGCYTKVLVCGAEEREGHVHTEACTTAPELSCGQEEKEGHSHTETCYGEAGELICGQEEKEGHSHTEACYTAGGTTCGLEEHEGHVHAEACYTAEFSCGLEEHIHTDLCYTDAAADVEEKAVWDGQYAGTNWKGVWGEDLVIAAKQQIGYRESLNNYTVAEDGSHKGYSRYGQLAGDLYVDWDAAFVNFCMYYAGLQESGRFPKDLETSVWYENFVKADGANQSFLAAPGGYEPMLGDLVFFQKENEETQTQMGIVSSYDKGTNTLYVIEGNSSNEVRENTYDATDPHITAYLKITELETAYKNAGTVEPEGNVVPGTVVTLEESKDSDENKAPEEPGTQDGETKPEESSVQDGETEPEESFVQDGEAETKESADPEENTIPNENGEPENEDALTEEEQQQVETVTALIAALPEQEEMEERFFALMDAEDEEGYHAYYLELYAQVYEAQNAYQALTERQKAQVVNAERLSLFEWMQAETLEQESVWEVMKPDEAYVNEITIKSMATGSAPFDETEGRGNDTTAQDKLVRTFDTVTYNFNINMKTWDISKSYNQARVKLEFVLPLTEKEAVFEQTAMAWMDQTEGYAPVVTKEEREINGVKKECQVLTCYKLLLPSEGNHSVVPGDFGENLTIYVRSMKNGQEFEPIISAAMEGGAWDGPCDNEQHKFNDQPAIEKKTVVPDKVKVTAAPKYNVRVKGESSYSDDFKFQGDAAWMEAYGEVAANTDIVAPLPGRAMKLGITLQLYNDNASKGLKGIELPDGNDITFDLKLSSRYTINIPKEDSEYKVGQEIEDTAYAPLLWSYHEVTWREYGAQNKDGRQIDDRLKATPLAPYTSGDGLNCCYQGGNWTATQEGDTIHITVSGYEIDPQKMPTMNADEGQYIRYDANVGCFSSGEIWLIQPFNKKEGTGQKPNYDIVETYGTGFFATTAEADNLRVTTVGGESLVQGVDGFQQMLTDDDRETRTLELTLGGSVQNRVRYADPETYVLGCGVSDNRDGRDYAAVGAELNLMGGLSYNANRIEENRMYLGTTLVKFYGNALELEKEDWFLHLEGGAALNGHDETEIEEAEKNFRCYYVTKRDGSDWVTDEELKNTYEDELEFYENLEDIPEGKLCVGMLLSFIGPGGEVDASDPYYRCYHKARVRDDMELAGKTFMLASTSRVWTREMFEEIGMGAEDLDLNKNPDLNIPELVLESKLWEADHYKSGNIDAPGSVFYEKETYRADGSGIEGTHNSDWYHWGDTLLIIGYKTKITKNLLQKDKDGQEKKTFSLDADQRVVDFKLQPATYYDKPGEFKHTARITVVDTLPKHMTYKPGSAYFGGDYKQTSEWGGTKGTIIKNETAGAAFPDPALTEPTVKKNADGTQTLTWIIEDVEIGTPMAPIYYSVDIGVRGNPDEDLPNGTTDLKNSVYITTPRDLRDPETTAEKHAEAGIAVTRGSASSFGKYTKQKVVDEDGAIDYVIYFGNNAETATSVVIMDTMPMNGIHESHFTGSYTFAEWKLDPSKCDASKLSVYYTFDTDYKDKTTKNVTREEIEQWQEAEIAPDGKIAIPGEAEGATKEQPYPVAWAVVGALESGKSVNIDLKIQLDPGASDKDRTETNYFVNLLSSGDTTTITETPTVRRTLEGLTWMDYNRNGIQEDSETETRISGVRVELLRLIEGRDPEDENSYENVYYPGTEKNESNRIIIETGQQISLRAGSGAEAVAYEQGRYRFTDLPAGTFAVRFTDGNETKITELNATKQDRGEDDTLDSDGLAVYDGEGKLEKTVILNLEMPKAEDLSVSLYESKNHDSGFYPDTLVKLQKMNEGGKALTGAIFTVKDAAGRTISFTYEEGKGYIRFEEEEVVDPSLEGKYYIAYAKNPKYVMEINGTYDGATPVLRKRNGNAMQLFDVGDHGGDLRSFLNIGSGKWLDLDGGNKWDGAKIHVWSNNAPNDNQKWHVTPCDGGNYIWPSTAENSGQWRMDLNGGVPKEDTPIHLYSANDTDAQKWILVPAGSSGNSAPVETQTDLSVDGNGSLTIHDLIPGDYAITEIKAPDGYSILRKPVSFRLNTDGTVEVTDSAGGMADVTGEGEQKILLNIRNVELYELPSAGGVGIYWYSIGGILLMFAAALILYKNKCREVLGK
ncbi:MAG: hypothetical protein HFI63_08665 [Lachnospiraceae bacterium]|nr:hypothetical protein [Lachnospiraceae bacterium]